MIKRSVRLTLFLLLVLTSAIGCSNNSESKNAEENGVPREVTTQEAQLLSKALSNNAEDKNASFEIESGVLGSNGFVANGKVDWINSVVEIDVSLFAQNQNDISNIATKDNVFESFLGLTTLANQAGLANKDWITRDFNPDLYATDVLTQFVAKLASPAPDNPILLKQNGAQYLGTENVDGVETKKFQNTPNLTYFLTKDGELKKVNARIDGFPNDISFIFSGRGSTLIDVPKVEDSFTVDEVRSFYPEKRPAF